MRKLQALRHANVVQYDRFYTDSIRFYFVMERCPGYELLDYMVKKNVWRESDGCALIKQTLEALKYIHGFGIMHRDLKLENLMVHKQDQINDKETSRSRVSLKLIDFGLGCNVGSDSALGAVGTPGYAAPEVYGRGSYNEVADVFSAGVVLYILFTGRPPFRPPLNMQNISVHVQSLFDGPDWSSTPFSFISDAGVSILDSMLLPNPVCRCTAAKALQHTFFKPRRTLGNEGALWYSSSSEVSFLKVMGVWSGSCKSSGVGSGALEVLNPLAKIQETADLGDDDEDSHILEALCVSIVHEMSIAVSIGDPGQDDCPIVAVSRGFYNLTGFSNSECVGRNCRFLNAGRADEMPPLCREGLRQATQEEQTFLGVVPNMKADGTPFNNLVHLAPLDMGSKTYMIGVQMETQDADPFPKGQHREEALAVVRKAHAVIRHWVRSSQCGIGAKKLRV
jgi:serine/threonine protein kinase